tara:strand:- start:166 stop:789 length:624 start_codon:yes stop_codon:yes gene_type:complete
MAQITTCNWCDEVVDHSEDERRYQPYEIVDEEYFCIDCYKENFIELKNEESKMRKEELNKEVIIEVIEDIKSLIISDLYNLDEEVESEMNKDGLLDSNQEIREIAITQVLETLKRQNDDFIERPFIHKEIKRVEDGFRFIRTLEEKGLAFHFDDGAEVLYELNLITWKQKNIINKRLDELFNPLFNWGEYEDAYGYALFILKEKESK